MSHPVFKKKLLASCVAAACSVSMSMVAQAQNEGVDEEVVVFGIRGSLERSADIKREAVGVVDAISAEDMGKFPDTNLAESLQRITGVSIDRRNGEGASITIRGFGGDNNMVLLNGRQMPAADNFGGGSGSGGTVGGATRAFNFANLASEAVSGIEVYKTGRADITSGGLGGTVNIKTTRPLDRPGFQAAVGGKLVNDTTVTGGRGDDFTPEVSGLVSWTDDDETVGVSLTAIYQERDSSAPNATVNDWNIRAWDAGNLGNNLYSWTRDPAPPSPPAPFGTQGAINAVIENAPADGQLYARPNDLRLAFSDRHRERTNAQLTVQFRPQDALTLTGDFTFAENKLEEFRGEQTFWFANGGSASRVVFDDNAVATPAIYEEASLGAKDNGYEQQYRNQTNTLESFGFNADWQVSDSFNLNFDFHDSSMESLPTGPANGSGEIAISVAGPIHAAQVGHFGGDLPYVTTTLNTTVGNNNGVVDIGDFGTQVGRIWTSGQVTDVEQLKIDGSLELTDSNRFDFGVDTSTVESHNWQSNRFMTFGNWGISDAAISVFSGTGLLEEFNLASQFDDYSIPQHQQFGVRGDAREIMEFVVARGQAGLYQTDLSQYAYDVADSLDTNDFIEEETTAFYLQYAMGLELGGMESNLMVGVRHEQTDVTSTALVVRPNYLRWEDNNDFQTRRNDSTDIVTLQDTADYDNTLPSIDFDIALTESLKGRFSYSTTIARPGYGNLGAAPGNFGTNGSTLNGAIPRAARGEASLVPLESNNIDISLEWYYDESSYVSFGLFDKTVDNFVGTVNLPEQHFGMQDATAGPRAQAAFAELLAAGITPDDTSLFVMTVLNDNPGPSTQFPVPPTDAQFFAAHAAGGQAYQDFVEDVATAYDVIPVAGDPITTWNTSVPVNTREASIDGFEVAVQHFFGDTGFGLQANYTDVNGDVNFDVLASPSASQFALTGLSNTANLVGIYENHGFAVRLAYNWRDSFLSQTNVGNSNNPRFVEEYSQVDLNVGYDVSDNLNVFFEGINLTEENIRQYARNEAQLWYLEDQGARYHIGARYTFD